jgi:carbamoyl-phosphate synthase large subunit
MSSSTDTVALVAGGGLVAAGVVWRTVRYARVRKGIRAGLADPNTAIRTAAVLQAVELGLASTAPSLLRAVRVETDPVVLNVVIEAVASRQWEPASTAAIVELRLWAKAYSDTRLETQRPQTAAEPMLRGVAGTVLPPSLHPLREKEFRRRDATDVAALDDEDELPIEVVADPDPLGCVRVLLTGAGGAAGISVIRALRKAGHYVIGVDADPMAAGLRLADEGHAVPRFDDPTYLAALIRIATVYDAQALMCTVAEEYQALSGATEYLEEAGLRTLMPTAETVITCIDKWLFAQAMTAAGLPVPATGLATADDVPGPWIVKPRFGRGSRDVHAVRNRKQLAAALTLTPDPIVQTQIVGREFTADALVFPAGEVIGISPRWRTATKAGISVLGTTFDDAAVNQVTTMVLKALGHVGPANVQGFVTPDGQVVIVEVNPRFSGGLPLSLHAGADLVGEYLRAIMGRDPRVDRLVARPGVTMVRYFDEVYEMRSTPISEGEPA